MKKILAAIVLFALLFSLSACGISSENASTSAPDESISISPSTDSHIQSTPKPTPKPTPTPTPTPTDGLKSDGYIHVYIVGEGEKVYTPNSSFISYLIYYPSSKHLIICMNGKDYVFANVSSSLWSDFKAADSVGKFYNQNIKGKTNYHINDYDGTNGDLIVLDYID